MGWYENHRFKEGLSGSKPGILTNFFDTFTNNQSGNDAQSSGYRQYLANKDLADRLTTSTSQDSGSCSDNDWLSNGAGCDYSSSPSPAASPSLSLPKGSVPNLSPVVSVPVVVESSAEKVIRAAKELAARKEQEESERKAAEEGRRAAEEAVCNAHRWARKIMGRNFLGIEEVVKHFNVVFTTEQLGGLVNIPFSEAVLQECKDTHILVAGFPMTTADIKKKAPHGFLKGVPFSRFWRSQAKADPNKDLLEDQEFAWKEKVGPRWYLIQKQGVEWSFNLTEIDHINFFAFQRCDEPVSASVLIYTTILNFEVTGERLFKSYFVRSETRVGEWNSSYVRIAFRKNGLDVTDIDYDEFSPHVGLPTARKPNDNRRSLKIYESCFFSDLRYLGGSRNHPHQYPELL